MTDLFTLYYLDHEQRIEDAIKRGLERAHCGETSFTIDIDDDIDEYEQNYIRNEIQKRLKKGR